MGGYLSKIADAFSGKTSGNSGGGIMSGLGGSPNFSPIIQWLHPGSKGAGGAAGAGWGGVKPSVAAAQSINTSRPDDPVFHSVVDKNGKLLSQYTLGAPTKVAADSLTFGKLASGGDLSAHTLGNNSAWLNLEKQQQGLGEQTALEQAAQSQAGASANAMSQLAMRGGLSSGAGAMAAISGANQSALAQQGVRRQGQQDRLGIDIAGQQDQSQRDLFNAQALTDADKFNITNTQDVSKFNIAGQADADKTNIANRLAASQFNSTAAFDANKSNVANALGGVQNQNQFNLGTYDSKMKEWGAGQTANAIAGGGKK